MPSTFQSSIRPREVIIDDYNWQQHAPDQDMNIAGDQKNRGRIPRDWQRQPHGSQLGSTIAIQNIPREKWTEMIQHMESSKTRLSDISDQAGLKSLDQNGTNYCWTNAVVTAMTILRARENQPFVDLSPASVAAQVKGFSNSGGWGGEALEFITQNGIARTELWPPNAIQRKYLTDAAKADAATRKVVEWYDLESRNFDQLMTLLLMRIPVAIGLNWWSHEVCAVDPVVLSTMKFGVRFRNSWSDSYGDHGFNILTESKATPDDACAPRVIMATSELKPSLATAV